MAGVMLNQLSEKQRLYQDGAAHRIRQDFGVEFIYRNQSGNWAIRKDVLAAFAKLTGDSVVWDLLGE
jgi:hypothetical protein